MGWLRTGTRDPATEENDPVAAFPLTTSAEAARASAVIDFEQALLHRAESMRRARKCADVTDDLIRDADSELLTAHKVTLARKLLAAFLVLCSSFSLTVPAAWVREILTAKAWPANIDYTCFIALGFGAVFLGLAEYVRHHK